MGQRPSTWRPVSYTHLSEQVLRRVGGIVDRMSMAIVIAGLFIGSSVVYYAKIEPVIFGIPVIGFFGYTSALVLALGLGREIWRNGHAKKLSLIHIYPALHPRGRHHTLGHAHGSPSRPLWHFVQARLLRH